PLCQQFGHILRGKAKMENGACTVSMDRQFHVSVQGFQTSQLGDVELMFQSIDHNGNALNFGEVAVLQEEVPGFTARLIQQGLIVGAIHNHWIFTVPEILYVHFQSLEPPLSFAKKVAYAFMALRSYPHG
ncbi:MAG TPA: DUF1259 domain-containing protein, partial [Bacillales bacterium]|nr:DUF1259 domain-containing protein [Bacillales bacterium]